MVCPATNVNHYGNAGVVTSRAKPEPHAFTAAGSRITHCHKHRADDVLALRRGRGPALPADRANAHTPTRTSATPFVIDPTSFGRGERIRVDLGGSSRRVRMSVCTKPGRVPHRSGSALGERDDDEKRRPTPGDTKHGFGLRGNVATRLLDGPLHHGPEKIRGSDAL
jgi:hypothetical protein